MRTLLCLFVENVVCPASCHLPHSARACRLCTFHNAWGAAMRRERHWRMRYASCICWRPLMGRVTSRRWGATWPSCHWIPRWPAPWLQLMSWAVCQRRSLWWPCCLLSPSSRGPGWRLLLGLFAMNESLPDDVHTGLSALATLLIWIHQPRHMLSWDWC